MKESTCEMPSRSTRLAISILLLVGAPFAANCQVETGGAVTPAAMPATQPDYHPSFGDLMTMAVQPRHIKLGLAGGLHNWDYAEYEVHELRNAFTRIARTIPTYQSIDIAEVMSGVTKAPLDAIEAAITNHSDAEFARTYAKLTDACNACHQMLKHAAVVIKVTDAAAYSDQEFKPARM